MECGNDTCSPSHSVGLSPSNMTTPPGCGLVSYGRNGSRNYLPLTSVSANVHIVDGAHLFDLRRHALLRNPAI